MHRFTEAEVDAALVTGAGVERAIPSTKGFTVLVAASLLLAAMEQERWELIPGAESNEQFSGRVLAAVERIAADHPDEQVAVFVHGGVIGALLSHAARSRRFAFHGADNGSISQLVISGDHAYDQVREYVEGVAVPLRRRVADHVDRVVARPHRRQHVVERGHGAREHHRDLADIAGRLEPLSPSGCVDVVAIESQGPIFQHRVLREGRLVFERDRRRRIDFESDAHVRYFDWKPTYDLARRHRRQGFRRWLESRR